MHINFLKQALDLAKIRKGYCAPNPAVGAVIVQNNQVLATGYHWGVGYPHAEVEALKKLPRSNEGGVTDGVDFYITLEPCCHQGKTPPCTTAIIQNKISRVFYGLKDPDKRVSGQGAATLESAGIPCIHLPLPEIDHFYQEYCYWQKHRRPYVTAKLALSIDGKIAGPNGAPVKISGPLADQFTQEQRKLADALFTTARTVCQDNPRLNVRLAEETIKKPVYILDRTLSIPHSSQIFETAQRVILFHGSQVREEKILGYQKKGAICIKMVDDQEQDRVPWDFILEAIGNAGVQSLWVEAGGRCFESLVKGNYLQQAYLYYSTNYVGSEGLAAFADQENLFKQVKKIAWQILGEDAVCQLLW